jgi:NhaA family Na+:H+ antiporter
VVAVAPYALLGAVLWLAVLKSGVHATLAGVALGFTVPIRDRRDPGRSPLGELEHDLHPTVAYAILPLFAFANAGISLAGLDLASLSRPVPLGVALGLVLGKPAGVLAFGGILLALGGARLPEATTWRSFVGVALLCGIGFTMSLFLASLAFEASRENLVLASRIGILAGTAVAALAGYAVLRFTRPARST